MNQTLSVRMLLQRKAIHFATALIPLYYHYSHNELAVKWITIALAVGFLTADFLRLKFSLAKKIFLNIFGKLLKQAESERRLTGATMLFVGMAATVILFKEQQAVPALLFVALADPLAAIVGQLYGKNYFWEKSLEGSAAFYLTASAIILIFTSFSWWGLVVAIIVTGVELLPMNMDDNLVIPLATAFLLALG
ncbi:diacylglycerol/polyprenol kinase family protein [Calditrichota bacterium LG25]